MLTTFDRYLFRRFFVVFSILFVSTFGLFVVIDGFTNVDGFQEGTDGSSEMLHKMAWYYTYQASAFLNMIGAILSIISVMVVFALLYRGNELLPILASGVPTYRLAVPIVLAELILTGVMCANQEWVVPRIVHQLHAPRGKKHNGAHDVEPVYDSRMILIDGTKISPIDRKISDAEFVLPVPTLVHDLTTLKANEAEYCDASDGRPSGWRLKNVKPSLQEINLTEQGQEIVIAGERPADVFVVTDVSYDLLYNRNRGFRYISTVDLIHRIRHPTTSSGPVRGQLQHLHTRLMQPLLNITVALVTVPLIIRKESRSLVGNMALCAGIMALLLGVLHGFGYLGSVSLVNPDLAAWGPVIVCGSLACWLSGYVQT